MVEQGTHKPLVGSSTLPPGTFSQWLGFTFFAAQMVAITLAHALIWTRGLRNISVVTQQRQNVSEQNSRSSQEEVVALEEARRIERLLKRKKNPRLAIYHLDVRAAPKAFGVGREFDSPPWHAPTPSVLRDTGLNLCPRRGSQP